MHTQLPRQTPIVKYLISLLTSLDLALFPTLSGKIYISPHVDLTQSQ